jgi:flagellar protein FliO/FliZ
MNTSSDIWFAFIRTFSMLFLVLALLIFAFYLVKKFATARGVKGSKDFIRVLCVHHLSPKEKLVLVNVLGETILIGVTPNNISNISSIQKDIDFSIDETQASSKFSDFLAQKIGKSIKTSDPMKKDDSILGKNK